MKVTSIEIHPANGAPPCILSFQDPRQLNPYNVKAVDGLDAEAISPRFYGIGDPNVKFYNLTLPQRKIKMRIELAPRFEQSESISGLRDTLYKMIASTRSGTTELKFKNDDEVVAVISGFIEKFEVPHFQQTPELQLTFACDDAFLKSPVETQIDVYTGDNTLLSANFEDDVSTAPHGFKFEMLVGTVVPRIAIGDPTDPSWTFVIWPLRGFFEGDIIHFSSEINNKYLYAERGDEIVQLADGIDFNSVWPTMFPGDNFFYFDPPGHLLINSVTYHATYWGV